MHLVCTMRFRCITEIHTKRLLKFHQLSWCFNGLTVCIKEALGPQGSGDEAGEGTPDGEVADVALGLIAGNDSPDAWHQKGCHRLRLLTQDVEYLQNTPLSACLLA